MRTGAIFARGSCRALKWMALLGVVFLLGGGAALAQTLTVTTHVEAEGYSDKIAVLKFSEAVWGNVPTSAFAVSGKSVDAVMGLPASAPGVTEFKISFIDALADDDSLAYTLPTDATRRLKKADGDDSGTDPDDVAADVFVASNVTEENNAPVLPAVGDFAVEVKAYTDASPAKTLPPVTGGSGLGAVTYAVTGLPAGLSVSTVTASDANFGKIIGETTVPVGTVAVVTWTATDTDSPPENDVETFRITVVGAPGAPAKPTIASAGSGELMVPGSRRRPTAAARLPTTNCSTGAKGLPLGCSPRPWTRRPGPRPRSPG